VQERERERGKEKGNGNGKKKTKAGKRKRKGGWKGTSCASKSIVSICSVIEMSFFSALTLPVADSSDTFRRVMARTVSPTDWSGGLTEASVRGARTLFHYRLLFAVVFLVAAVAIPHMGHTAHGLSSSPSC